MLNSQTKKIVLSKSFNFIPFVAGLMAIFVLAFPLRVAAQTPTMEVDQTDVNTLEQTVMPSTMPTDPVPALVPTPVPAPDTAGRVYPYKQTFKISAYYSPLPNQQRYATGSYSGDLRLNGDGVKAADGTVVYPGMIAAPKGYPFGTKMHIPGIGTVAVHDRGGAIVHSGYRGNNYDRLDVWMGYGDTGLKRALNWGKRTIESTVYGINDSIVENVELAGYSDAEKSVQKTSSDDVQAVNLASSIAFGSSSQDVAKIQTILKKLNYYHGEITSVYDQTTRSAVTQFQIAEEIIAHKNAFGAGYLGPKTMRVLAGRLDVPTANAASVEFDLQQTFADDLHPGDSGDDVRRLQVELKRVNLLGIEATGFYGEVTAHAVLKFQQINQLTNDPSSDGDGILGLLTRAKLNALIEERKRTEQLIAARREEDNL